MEFTALIAITAGVLIALALIVLARRGRRIQIKGEARIEAKRLAVNMQDAGVIEASLASSARQLRTISGLEVKEHSDIAGGTPLRRPETMDEARTALVEKCMWVSERADATTKRKSREPSLARYLFNDVAAAAQRYVEDCGGDIAEFETSSLAGMGVVETLQFGLTDRRAFSTYDRNTKFWNHVDRPADRVMAGNAPYMNREVIDAAARSYLQLPYRASGLERVLVDVVMATEVLGYLDEQIGNKAKAILSITLDHGRPVPVLLLPPTSRIFRGAKGARAVAETAVRKRIIALQEAYNELTGSGPVSAKRVREAAGIACEVGIAWPSSLYALLDDNLRRSGTL